MSDPRRKVLKETVCLLLSEIGFTSATDDSLETLVEMLQSSNFFEFTLKLYYFGKLMFQ